MKSCRAILSGLAVTMLASCGIPADSQARQVQPPPGPYRALASPAPVNTEPGTVPETLCLVKDGKLIPVVRRVKGEPAVTTLMQDLLAGPTDAERADGATSALPGAYRFGDVDLVDGRAVVELTSQVDDAGRSDETLAIGQVVCTLDARPDVDGVAFADKGKPVGVPRGDGALSVDPLTMADYAGLLGS